MLYFYHKNEEEVHLFEPCHLISNNGILTSVYSDEPVQPPLKLRNSK